MGSNLDKLRQANNKNINKTKQLQRVNLIDTVIGDNTQETLSHEKITTEEATKSIKDESVTTQSNNVTSKIVEERQTVEVPKINSSDSVAPTINDDRANTIQEQVKEPAYMNPTQLTNLDPQLINLLMQQMNAMPNVYKQSTQFAPEKEEYRKDIQNSVSEWSSLSPRKKRVRNKILSIRVYPEIYDRIEMIAIQNNCSLNEVMNILLAQLFNVEP